MDSEQMFEIDDKIKSVQTYIDKAGLLLNECLVDDDPSIIGGQAYMAYHEIASIRERMVRVRQYIDDKLHSHA